MQAPVLSLSQMSPLQVQGRHRAPQGSAATLATVPRCCTSPCSQYLCPLCWELWNPSLLQGYMWLGGLGLWFPWLLSPHRWCLSLPGGSQPAWKEAFSRTSDCMCQKISVLIRSCADWLAVQVLSEIHINCVEHKTHSHIWRQTETRLQISCQTGPPASLAMPRFRSTSRAACAEAPALALPLHMAHVLRCSVSCTACVWQSCVKCCAPQQRCSPVTSEVIHRQR